MSEKPVVITVHGHERTIDEIAVSLFDETCHAKIYCTRTNDFELQNNKWIFAKIISKNKRYSLDELLPVSLDALLELEDRTIQRILNLIRPVALARVLKFGVVGEAVKEKIFNNLSERAAQTLKEDMEVAEQAPRSEIIKLQEEILDIICKFSD